MQIHTQYDHSYSVRLSATEQAAQSYEQYCHPPQVVSSDTIVNKSLCASMWTILPTPSGVGRRLQRTLTVCSPRGVWFTLQPGVRSSRPGLEFSPPASLRFSHSAVHYGLSKFGGTFRLRNVAPASEAGACESTTFFETLCNER